MNREHFDMQMDLLEGAFPDPVTDRMRETWWAMYQNERLDLFAGAIRRIIEKGFKPKAADVGKCIKEIRKESNDKRAEKTSEIAREWERLGDYWDAQSLVQAEFGYTHHTDIPADRADEIVEWVKKHYNIREYWTDPKMHEHLMKNSSEYRNKFEEIKDTI